jgi:hypothetical protein
MKYIIHNIDSDVKFLINKLVKTMCKENNINYEKQDYRVLFSDEKIFYKYNGVKFTSGFNKSFSFYGKIYSNKKNKIIENLYFKDEFFVIEPNDRSLLIMSECIDNSTFVENDEELLHFYVAPSYLLDLQDPKLWQTL